MEAIPKEKGQPNPDYASGTYEVDAEADDGAITIVETIPGGGGGLP